MSGSPYYAQSGTHRDHASPQYTSCCSLRTAQAGLPSPHRSQLFLLQHSDGSTHGACNSIQFITMPAATMQPASSHSYLKYAIGKLYKILRILQPHYTNFNKSRIISAAIAVKLHTCLWSYALESGICYWFPRLLGPRFSSGSFYKYWEKSRTQSSTIGTTFKQLS